MTTNPNQAGITITVQTVQYSCAPGSKLNIPLLLINKENLPEQVRLTVEGIPHVWVSAEKQIVLLQSGEQPTIVLTIQPPVPSAESPTDTPEPPNAPLTPTANTTGPGQGFMGEQARLDASASQPGSSPFSSFCWSLGNGKDLPAYPEASVYLTGLQQATQATIQENRIVLDSPPGRLEFYLVEPQ